MKDFSNLNGKIFKEAILNGEFPEYKYLIYPNGEEVPHDNPYHKESILDHVCRVVDEAAKLSRKFNISEEDHIVLMLAAMWHDVGKIFTRKEKNIYVCEMCGRPHAYGYYGKCKNENCNSHVFTHRTIMGYHGHEKIGVNNWIFRNIAIREGLSSLMFLL